MLRILTIAALLGAPLAGLAGAHSSPEDPVTCTDPDYPGTPIERMVAGQTIYVIAKTPSGAGEISDANKAEPVSVWLETNSAAGPGYDSLQWKDYVCTYSDGHVYEGSKPQYQSVAKDTTAPVFA